MPSGLQITSYPSSAKIASTKNRLSGESSTAKIRSMDFAGGVIERGIILKIFSEINMVMRLISALNLGLILTTNWRIIKNFTKPGWERESPLASAVG